MSLSTTIRLNSISKRSSNMYMCIKESNNYNYDGDNNNYNNLNPKSESERLQDSITKNAKMTLLPIAIATPSLLGMPSNALGAARGYKAAQSIYAPGSRLYRKPGLPQSALLNSLPFRNELIGDVQGNLESFTLLIKPNAQQKAQIARNTSTLWYNLKVNAQRAAGMFLYNEQQFEIANDKIPKYLLKKFMNKSEEFAEEERRRGDRVLPTLKFLEEKALSDLRTEALKLVNASRNTDSQACLRYMNLALLRLCQVSSYLVPLSSKLEKLEGLGPTTSETVAIPRLVGRAEVVLTYCRKGAGVGVGTERYRTVRMIVDGVNYPMSGGSFIELCKKGFYDNLPVKSDVYDVPELDDVVVPSAIERLILGSFPAGYRDTVTNNLRRIPLEVLRIEKNGTRQTVFGAARNTAVFTKAEPVHSLSTPGATALLHNLGDRNGASASFFTPRPTVPLSAPLIERIDKRFAVFGFVVQGLDVLTDLREDDLLVSAQVEPGPWQLIRLKNETVSPFSNFNTDEADGYGSSSSSSSSSGSSGKKNVITSSILYSGFELESLNTATEN